MVTRVLWRLFLGPLIGVVLLYWHAYLTQGTVKWDVQSVLFGLSMIIPLFTLSAVPGAVIKEIIIGRLWRNVKNEEEALWRGAFYNTVMSLVEVCYIYGLKVFWGGNWLPIFTTLLYSSMVVGAWDGWLRFRSEKNVVKLWPRFSLLQMLLMVLGTGSALYFCSLPAR